MPAKRHANGNWPEPVLGILLLLILCVISLSLGAVNLTPAALGQALWQGPSSDGAAGIVWQLRLPRLLLALIGGAALAVAGTAMQTLFRNPMADPGLTGVSGGATLAVALLLTLCPELARPMLADASNASPLASLQHSLLPHSLMIAACAVCGGFIAAAVVQKLAQRSGWTSTSDLLLAGLAVNTTAGAAIAWLCTHASSDHLRDFLAWTYGDLGRADLNSVLISLPLLGVAIAVPFVYARQMDALLVGESFAAQIGLHPERFKKYLLFSTILAAAVTAAAAGPIGFIGLIAPHLVRNRSRGLHARTLPMAALTGSCLLAAADLLGRTVWLPNELPAGILTALIGGPYFLWRLLRARFTAHVID